jgi:serine/threonine-protein kinase
LAWRPDAVPPADPAAARAPVGPATPPAPAPATTAADPVPRTLREQAAADREAVARLVGRWVPQISSKAPGMVIGGVTVDEARILAEFRANQAKFPDAALVRSGDYRSFTRRGLWVTVVARAFADADAANEWCERQGFDTDDCFAKRLTNSGTPRGNTVLRR